MFVPFWDDYFDLLFWYCLCARKRVVMVAVRSLSVESWKTLSYPRWRNDPLSYCAGLYITDSIIVNIRRLLLFRILNINTPSRRRSNIKYGRLRVLPCPLKTNFQSLNIHVYFLLLHFESPLS